MSAVSKIQASLASATQETTLALANLNFDFSLFKVEAPPAYHPLGAALSVHRRSAAENGMPHVIARRLGSLFETLLPHTPNLITAYGTRASEISQSLSTTSSRNANHGPFQKFVGLDGTSIWAAATSGPSAVAAHLLACMLARVWSPAEAVSIWEELVTERKKALIPADDADSIPTRDVVAAQLVIAKEQLAEWDASARAWLRAADTSNTTKKQQKELMTVLSNVNIPVGSHPKVYDSVCKAWVTALSTIDKLVHGHPYSAQDGSVLVALSAWHLYPDIIALGPSSRELFLHDPLIGNGGALTIGLQSSDPDTSGGVHWSLSLAHLRYYGSPVLTRATVDSESGRLTFPHFLLVCLGGLIASWGLPITQIKDAARLTVLIKSCFPELETFECGLCTFDWLRPLASAAEAFCSARETERDAIAKLIKLGHRRRNILSRSEPNGVFYLRSLDFSCVLKSADDQVRFYRTIFGNWKRSDVPLLLRIGGKIVNGGAFSTVVPTDTTSKDNTNGYKCYIAEGRQNHQNFGSHDTFHAYKSADIAFTSTGREITWRHPPIVFDSAEVQTTIVQDSIVTKERSRWGLKPRKAVDIPVLTRDIRGMTFEFVCGDTDTVSLYCAKGYTAIVEDFGNHQVDLRTLTAAFSNDAVDPTRLAQHLKSIADSSEQELIGSCYAVAHATQLYKGMPGATISPKILESVRTISQLPWASDLLATAGRTIQQATTFCMSMSRAAAFSCVAYFESGIAEVPRPLELETTMAISSADSLYVAAQLLCDPARDVKSYEIHRVVGNIGRAGLAFLIPPQQPMVRPSNSERWTLVNHNTFDGKLENNFQSTSLHLGFTGYEIPLALSDHGGRFVEAFFIEAVVSVHDSGRWVADLDVLAALQSPSLFSLVQQPSCKQSSPAGSVPDMEFISLDNWEELLDPPSCASVIRAHGNWQARLAAANISVMLGHKTILFRDHGCWTCAVNVMDMIERTRVENPSVGYPPPPVTEQQDYVFVL